MTAAVVRFVTAAGGTREEVVELIRRGPASSALVRLPDGKTRWIPAHWIVEAV